MSQLAARNNLSTELAAVIRDRIVSGEFAPGERINEVRVAEELAVSRTPLREALSTLASEGLVQIRARRGFFIPVLDASEIEQFYQIRAILDPAALELAGIPGAAALDALEGLNREIASSAGSPNRTIDLDDRWHLELLTGCPNRFLLDVIQQFMRRKRALEYAYMRDRQNVSTAVEQHTAILDALRAGDLPRAVAALRANMQSAVEPLVEWTQSGANE